MKSQTQNYRTRLPKNLDLPSLTTPTPDPCPESRLSSFPAAMQASQVHVAILPSPGMGHIIPLLEFARRLVSHHGFRVTFLVLTTDASTAQSQLLRSAALPDQLHVLYLPPAHISVPQDAGIETRMSLIVRESVPYLRPVLSAGPTVLVVDIFGTDVFDELQLPKYVFFTSTALLLSVMMWLPTLDRQVRGEYADLKDPVSVPGCKPIPIEDLMDPLLDRSNERYSWFLHQASRFPLADGILINTSEILEPVTLKALREDVRLKGIPTPPVYPVGPVTDSTEGPLSENESLTITWLDQQPTESVLYVSFGSGGTLSAEQVTELAWGLELSRQRFIWVFRAPTRNQGSGTFFTAGGGTGDPSDYLPDGFLTRTKGKGLVVQSWAPQREILRHGAIGAFLSHCGWNSALESIVHGVAMIAWPLYAEQRSNASTLAEELGVAVKVMRETGEERIRREEIERVVRMMMEEEEGKGAKIRVRELRERVLSGLNEGGSSFNSLHEVISRWKAETGESK